MCEQVTLSVHRSSLLFNQWFLMRELFAEEIMLYTVADPRGGDRGDHPLETVWGGIFSVTGA